MVFKNQGLWFNGNNCSLWLGPSQFLAQKRKCGKLWDL